MKNLLLVLFCVFAAVACKKKLETVYQPPAATSADPYRGTCTVDGIVQNFDSCRATYSTNNNLIYLYLYKDGFVAMNFTLYNQNWNNFPSYQQFPKGVGTYTYTSGSFNPGSFNGSFIDMSSQNQFSSMLQGGSVTITENDSVNQRMSGTFTNVNGTSSFNSYTFMEGQFKKVRLEYW
jgi:hypothetical protein